MAESSFFDGKRCLVLDDEFLIALDIQDILERAGASVRSFSDIGHAMQALTGGAQFDLAVLDIRMGVAPHDTITVAEFLAASKTPFVFVTGLCADNVATRRFPNAPVVEKPYQPRHLLDALRRAYETYDGS